MYMKRKSRSAFCLALFWCFVDVESFVFNKAFLAPKDRHKNIVSFGAITSSDFDLLDEIIDVEADETEDLESLTSPEIKSRLLDLLPRMLGTTEEFKLVESYVNILEDRYKPVQTLDFLNMAMSGEWQLLFSTNLSRGPKPHFRLREQFQRVETNSLKGLVSNTAVWDLAEDGQAFTASGTFTVKCPYVINQGARMVLDLEENILKLAKGSAVPNDIEGLVGLLNRAMAKELFDPSDHAMDTTYLDANLRIVRMTGPRLEGVRDVFIRRGSMEVDPRKNS